MIKYFRQGVFEWRLARLEGVDADEERAAFEYQHGFWLSDEERGKQPQQALTAAGFFALYTWAMLELDPAEQQWVMPVLATLGIIIGLIWNLRKSDDELEEEAVSLDSGAGPPGFFQRHGKRLADLGWALAFLGFVWLMASDIGGDGWHFFAILAVIIGGIFLSAISRLRHLRYDGTTAEYEIDDGRMIAHIGLIFSVVVIGLVALYVMGRG